MAKTNLSSSLGFPSSGSEMVINVGRATLIVSMVSILLAVTFVVLLYLYFQYYRRSRYGRRQPQLIFADGELPVPSRGLDAAVLRSLPIALYNPGDFKDGLECAVCLSELTAGEEARLLPKCNHGFHLECIDMWFESHTTCPICRCPVAPEASGEAPPPQTDEGDGNRLSESPALHADVLFWGNQNQERTRRSTSQEDDSVSPSSGSSERMLVISIPVRSTEGFIALSLSPLRPPSCRSHADEMKSPAEDGSPAVSKIRSFRTLLRRGKRTGGSSCCSPRIGDIEQALVGSEAAYGVGSSRILKSPKTPASSL